MTSAGLTATTSIKAAVYGEQHAVNSNANHVTDEEYTTK